MKAIDADVTGMDRVASRMIIRVLTAGREVRAMVASPAGAPAMHAMVDPRAPARLSFIAADRDDGGSDGAAGCEFVDDRIRLPE